MIPLFSPKSLGVAWSKAKERGCLGTSFLTHREVEEAPGSLKKGGRNFTFRLLRTQKAPSRMAVPELRAKFKRLPPRPFYGRAPTRGGSGGTGLGPVMARAWGGSGGNGLTRGPGRPPGSPATRPVTGRPLRPSLGRGLPAAGRERLRPGGRTQAPLSAAWRGPSCSPGAEAGGGGPRERSPAEVTPGAPHCLRGPGLGVTASAEAVLSLSSLEVNFFSTRIDFNMKEMQAPNFFPKELGFSETRRVTQSLSRGESIGAVCTVGAGRAEEQPGGQEPRGQSGGKKVS